MMFKNLKNIDKVMYVIFKILAIITILVISYFILFNVMNLLNKIEYYPMLKNVYKEFYNALKIVSMIALPIIFLGFIGLIPYLILSVIVFIFFLIRFIKNKEKDLGKGIFIGILLIISVFLIINGVIICPINGRYDLYVNSEISKIENNEVKLFITEQMKEYNGKKILKKDYYIYRIEIKRNFPNDYDGTVFYRDIIDKKKKIGICDDDVIMKYTEDRTNEFSIKSILLIIVGEVTYIVFIIFFQKELKHILKYKE